MSAPESGSSPPRHCRIQCTAVSLSHLNKAQPPVADGRSAHEDTRTTANKSMPKSSSTLIDKSSTPRTDLLEPQNHDCSWAVRSQRL